MAKQATLSPSLITAIVQQLIKKGMVVESAPTTQKKDAAIEAEQTGPSLGRKPIPLQVRGDAGYLVGVDLGSFFLRIVITDINGKLVYESRSRTELNAGRERVLEKTFLSIHESIGGSNIPRRLIKGIGIAHSGVIDSKTGVVLSYPRPGQMAEWKNVPLRELFEKEFDLPCLVEDSVRTSTIAEKCFGAARDLNNFLYIDVGMGVGAGIFLDGRIYEGAGGRAGEFGHITVNENGSLCSCGNTGCLQTVASCAAIIQNVRSAMEQGTDSRIREAIGDDLEKVSIELIAQAAREDDSLAYRVLQRSASYIGIGLANLINLLNPSVVIFGGGAFPGDSGVGFRSSAQDHQAEVVGKLGE
ncbi:MAG TPA: ROK family protein [Alloacidobacterium sp.]|nr:ROK family protein [Alloacidobacterium sp.]